jgi:hypothetical protein
MMEAGWPVFVTPTRNTSCWQAKDDQQAQSMEAGWHGCVTPMYVPRATLRS